MQRKKNNLWRMHCPRRPRTPTASASVPPQKLSNPCSLRGFRCVQHLVSRAALFASARYGVTRVSCARSFDQGLHCSQPSPAASAFDSFNKAPYLDVTFVACSGTSLRPRILSSVVLFRDVPMCPRNVNRTVGDVRKSSIRVFVNAHWEKFEAAGWILGDIDWDNIYVKEVRHCFPRRA